MELMERRRILLNTPHINIVTGLQFVTDMVAPLESLVISFSPIQDLNGYDNPWPAGGGKNLFDPQKLIDAGATYTNGKYEATQTIIQSISLSDITFKENTQYYFYAHGAINSPSSSGSMRIKLTYTDSTVSYIAILAGEGERDLDGYSTSGKTIQSAEFSAYGTLGTYTNWISKFMICEASDGTEYAPYSNVCPITGWTGVSVKRTGKNLLTATQYRGGYAYAVNDDLKYKTASPMTETDGDYSINITSAWNGVLFATGVLKAGTYRLSFTSSDTNLRASIYVTNENLIIKDSVANVAGSGTSRSVTVSEGDRIAVYIGAGVVAVVSLSDIQVEYGSTATSYEPYTGETYSIDWTDEAGTVYSGNLDVTTGVLTVTHAIVDMGTLTWTYSRYATPIFQTSASALGAKRSKVLSPIYTYKPDFWNVTGSDFCIAIGGNVNVSNSNYTAPSAFKSAMSGTPFIYELAEPITYQLTPQQIRTLKGTNNLFSNSNGEETINYWTHLD